MSGGGGVGLGFGAGNTVDVEDGEDLGTGTGVVTCVPRLRGKRGAYGTTMDGLTGDGLSFIPLRAVTISATGREGVSNGVSFESVVSLPPSESDTDWKDEVELT